MLQKTSDVKLKVLLIYHPWKLAFYKYYI